MKKKVFLFAVLAGAICFASCKGDKDVDPTGKVQVVVNPREVTLNDEETSIRLSATLTPNDPTAVITWVYLAACASNFIARSFSNNAKPDSSSSSPPAAKTFHGMAVANAAINKTIIQCVFFICKPCSVISQMSKVCYYTMYLA